MRNISWNTLQVLGNQILGVFIFLLLSRYLDKESYGELNWSLAVLTTLTAILSLRLEQVIVRNIAAGKDASVMLTLFVFHTVTAALLFFLVLVTSRFLFPEFFGHHPLLWLLSFSQLLLFISLPFRQLVTGRSAFGWLAVLSLVSNVVRCAGLLGFVLFREFSLSAVVVLFTVSALAEWLLGSFIVSYPLKVPFDWKQSFSGVIVLIKESLPQVGLVFLTVGMARLDWILMGLFSTPAHTAEYSFAYRAYEFSPLPLLVLAPFLLNSLARRYSSGKMEAPVWLNDFVRAGLIFGSFLPLLGVLLWTPLMDRLTLHKYGSSNFLCFLLLSGSIPFQYLINVHWTAAFAQNRLRHIFINTAITAAVVLAGDALLIPYFAGEGAALVWLVAMGVQYFLYARRSLFSGSRDWNIQLAFAAGAAVIAGTVALLLPTGLGFRIVVAVIVYFLAAGLTGLVAWRKDRDRIISLLPAALIEWVRSIDWPLLLFLAGVLNVKFFIKVIAILFAFILYRKRSVPGALFRKNHLWFYAGMVGLALLNVLLSIGSLSFTGFLAFCLGSGYWLLAIFSAYFVYLFVQEGDVGRIHRTVGLLLLLNSVVILISFLIVCFQAGTLNPYTYEGEHRRYFINTGDMMTGIGLDGSVTTALIAAFGFLYFLYRNQNRASLFCLVTVLLSGSNFVNIMLMVISLFVFIFHSNRLQKSMMVVSVMLMVIFWAKVSPENGMYVHEIMKRVDKKNVYIEPVPIPNAKNNEFVEGKAVVRKEATMKTFEQTLYPPKMEDSFRLHFKSYNRSGRWVAMQQMAIFFARHPALLPLGAGMGNFSSRLAFKTTALDIEGGYPAGRRFIHPFFRDNYLYLYLFYHSRDEGQHSVVNKPDSVYGQMLGEYGIVGLLLFGVLYAAPFLKGSRSLSYGLPLLLLMGMAFFTEYWFEQLSVVILFEFLLLLDRRSHLNPNLQPTHQS